MFKRYLGGNGKEGVHYRTLQPRDSEYSEPDFREEILLNMNYSWIWIRLGMDK